MRIRNGFVSNSSSTSFLVAWDKRPERLADVQKFIGNRDQAKLLLEWMKEQKGLYLCVPPHTNCAECKERFRCYTGGGALEELARLIRSGGWRSDDMEEYEDDEYTTWSLELAEKFLKANKGMVAYCFRIADWGEGCSCQTEADMRKGKWCNNLAVEVWE